MTEINRSNVQDLAQKFYSRNDPTGWFEELYSNAAGDESAIQWADLAINPNLDSWVKKNNVRGDRKQALVVGCGLGDDAQALSDIQWADLAINPNLDSWVKKNNVRGDRKQALVVGCGLGDDAQALSELGFGVTGFDISPTAIAWCKKRFPESPVNYIVDDLLNPQVINKHKYDFILESYTLQALPADVRSQGIESISKLLAHQGTLLVICRGREESEPATSLPFPLTKKELALFERLGLEQVEFEDYLNHQSKPGRRFRIEYTV
ncbi:MAG: class I SAM-dependent methyltransferase [Cyanobacteria bacterium P01_G01_bin.19]